jgi:hypothetical protein
MGRNLVLSLNRASSEKRQAGCHRAEHQQRTDEEHGAKSPSGMSDEDQSWNYDSTA